MYNKTPHTITTISINDSYEGEPIEQKIRRIMNNKEPLTDGAELIYTERNEGVKPGHNIRTDRWEVAIDAMDKVDKAHKAKREDRHKTAEQKETEKIAKESAQNMKKEGENTPQKGQN